MSAQTSLAPDVVVVGGGIVGASAAAFLAGEGARVVLVEREGLASAASGANSGVIQHPFDTVLADLYRETIALYRELTAVSAGFRLAPQPAGMLFVSAEEALASRQAAVVRGAFPELHVEVVGGGALRALEPALADDLWACRVADIGYPVTPGATTYAYASLAEARGATIRQGRAATLELDGDAVVGVRVAGQLIGAGAVLVAAGPWTPAVIDPTGRWLPIRPLWGVVVEVELATQPSHVLEQAGIDATIGSSASGGADHELVFSLVSVPGVSVVGSTFLPGEPDPQGWLEPILAQAARYVAGVADAPIRGAHACPRPLSADGLPLVGPVAGRHGLYVCAGHGPWGISTGPATARMIADAIVGREARIPAEFSPLRFGPLGL